MDVEKKLRIVWNGIKARCYNKKNATYKNYGARGIKMCEEWCINFGDFYEWAIKNGYKEGLTIDRIDVNGNYEPNNCRWATMKVQANNKRNNVYFTYKGKKHTVTEWSDIAGVPVETITNNIKKGYTGETVFLGENSNRLKGLRLVYGYTQKEMAEKLHTTRENIANYEAGRREPSAAFYQNLLNNFKVSETFIGGVILEFAIKKRIASTKD